MEKAKTCRCNDIFFELDLRLKKIENAVFVHYSDYGASKALSCFGKCASSYSKIGLANLFYILMDEGILYFDPDDAKRNRADFQKFIIENFSYNDNEGSQKAMTSISRQFSECKGYTYKADQLKFLDGFIALMQERRRRLERW